MAPDRKLGPLRRSPDVLAKRLDEGAVLVHLASHQIFELNATAARIWDLTEGEPQEEAIVVQIVREFEIDRVQAATEVATLIDQFRREGFLLDR
jgi:hypothetical protein